MSNKETSWINPDIKKWQCSVCHALLGYVEKDEIIRVKRADHYLEIEGGKRVSVVCTRCGKINEILERPEEGVQDIQS